MEEMPQIEVDKLQGIQGPEMLQMRASKDRAVQTMPNIMMEKPTHCPNKRFRTMLSLRSELAEK
eukprot:9444944-Karenia_brevis.AAC.1